jgi:hypothetical protein
MVEMVLIGLAVASVLVVAFSLWLSITATIGVADTFTAVTEQRRLNRLVEAKSREQRRHRRAMRRIRNRR